MELYLLRNWDGGMNTSKLNGPGAAIIAMCAAAVFVSGCTYDLPSMTGDPEASIEPVNAPGADQIHTGSVTTAKTPGNLTVVQVKHGDSLSSIARAHGFSWQELAAANHIEAPYAIKAGQTLVLPAGGI